MNRPTKEQERKLYEWCGFEEQQYLDTSGKVCGSHWLSPDGSWGQSGFPPLDLNSQFKYAPRRMTPELWRTILRRWVAGITGDYEEDVIALFWSIWKLIEEEK